MLFCSTPSPGVSFSLPIGSLRGEGAKTQPGQCTRFVLVLQLFFLRLTAPQKPSHLVGLAKEPALTPPKREDKLMKSRQRSARRLSYAACLLAVGLSLRICDRCQCRKSERHETPREPLALPLGVTSSKACCHAAETCGTTTARANVKFAGRISYDGSFRALAACACPPVLARRRARRRPPGGSRSDRYTA